MIHLALLLAFLALAPTAQKTPSDLGQRVTEYWDFLVARDKASALPYVTPDSRNDFIRRQEPLMHSWRLKSIERLSEEKARVTVEIERMTPDGTTFGFSPITENWVLKDNLWMASIAFPDQIELLKTLTNKPPGESREIPITGQFRPVPEILKIWFLTPRQVGMVRLQNETPSPIVIESVDYDESRFKLLEVPDRIEAQSRAPLRLEFTGEEIKKNLTSEVVVRFRHKGRAKSMTVQVLYNVFSDGARGLFGLTKEEADKLPRGAVPTPVIPVPKPQEDPPTPPRKPPLK